jgi:hypothetical protein
MTIARALAIGSPLAAAVALSAVAIAQPPARPAPAPPRAGEAPAKRVLVRGAYADPRPFWDKGLRLDAYGVNAVFVRAQSLSEPLVRRARAEGARVFAEFGTLNASYGLDKHPDAHPIDDTGKPAPRATWFLGVCPTHEGFRAARMKALRDLLARLEVDGVFMDYLHWHAQFEDPYPVFVKTCFCERCLAAFQKWAGVRVPGANVPERSQFIFAQAARKWEDWRVSVLVGWAREIRSIVKAARPRAVVGLYHAAWKDEDFWGARRRCLGLDFDALAAEVDVFSPMPYHGRSGMPVGYVADFVKWFSDRLPFQTAGGKYPQLWPIVQAEDATAAELEQAMRGGLAGKSTGVMMFTFGSVAADPAKLEVLKRVYGPAAGR